VGTVNEPVEDGVGYGGISDQFVPTVRLKLAGNERGGDAVPVIEKFQEVAVLCGGGFFQSSRFS
jgi:hypothetical protein